MTDAALPVTQSSVEQFTERYLTAHGCTIDKQGSRWVVKSSAETTSNVVTGDVTLICSTEQNVGEDMEPLHPESSFFHQLIEEASKDVLAGRITIDADDAETLLPEWLTYSPVSVEKVNFTPFYNRTAVVVLFRVSIESVSEYQTELLRAYAVDTHSEEHLPRLAETLLSRTTPGEQDVESTQPQLNQPQVVNILERIRDGVVENIQPTIDEVHQNASRSAESEIEDYRQMQEQRIGKLEKDVESLSGRIDNLNEAIQQSDGRDDRIESLKKRKELKSELEALESELSDLRHCREQGYPEEQRAIRERYALEVDVEPVTLTEVEYERGDIELHLVRGSSRRKLTLGYGSGAGVTEETSCEACDSTLGKENPLGLADGKILCSNCSS